jgi:hypothetical protein
MANVLNYSLEAAARTRRSPDVRVVAARKDDAPAILLPSENVVSASFTRRPFLRAMTRNPSCLRPPVDVASITLPEVTSEFI